MGHGKSSPKGKVHSNTGTPQETRKKSNKTADQFRAHHGEVPKHLQDHLPDFIGSVDNVINITEITSQADTATNADESNLGEIAGRGYGASDNKVFNFHSDDYGILMLCHSIVPESVYGSFGIDQGNTMIYYNDYYQEEYMNIGLQPVPKYLLNALDLQTGSEVPAFHPHPSDGGDSPTTDVGILSYAPKDFQYKEYHSRVHGFFNPSRQLFGQSIHIPDSVYGYSDMQSFMVMRGDMALRYLWVPGGIWPANNTFDFTKAKLYVNPRIFDTIFSVSADDTELTDEFISHVKFVCHASQPMSILGLPKF